MESNRAPNAPAWQVNRFDSRYAPATGHLQAAHLVSVLFFSDSRLSADPDFAAHISIQHWLSHTVSPGIGLSRRGSVSGSDLHRRKGFWWVIRQHVHNEVSTHRTSFWRFDNRFGRALVFGAGLILGFDMFAKREVDFEVDTAFSGAKEILGLLSEQSAQAGHYAEILELLASAITEQRRKSATQGRSKLIGRLFPSIGDDETSSGVRSASRPFENPILSTSGQPTSEGPGHWLLGPQLAMPADIDSDLIGGWDTLDLTQWDNFPFNSPRNFVNDG